MSQVFNSKIFNRKITNLIKCYAYQRTCQGHELMFERSDFQIPDENKKNSFQGYAYLS